MDILFRQSIKLTSLIRFAGSRQLFNATTILNKKLTKQLKFEQQPSIINRRGYGDDQNQLNPNTTVLDSATYEKISSETLESLSDYFEQLIESTAHLKNTDTNFSVIPLLFSINFYLKNYF